MAAVFQIRSVGVISIMWPFINSTLPPTMEALSGLIKQVRLGSLPTHALHMHVATCVYMPHVTCVCLATPHAPPMHPGTAPTHLLVYCA